MDDVKVVAGIWLVSLGWIALTTITGYKLVKHVWLKTLHREYHYTNLQLCLIMAIIYALAESIFAVAAGIPYALDLGERTNKFMPFITDVLNLMLWVLPGVICTFVANALVAGNARGRAPFITYWVLMVCMNMIDRAQWLCNVATIILSGVILMNMMANPSIDEYKLAQEAVWPESDPMWKEKLRVRRREWLKAKITSVLIAAAVCMILSGFVGVWLYSVGYDDGARDKETEIHSSAKSYLDSLKSESHTEADLHSEGYTEAELHSEYYRGYHEGVTVGYERARAAYDPNYTEE